MSRSRGPGSERGSPLARSAPSGMTGGPALPPRRQMLLEIRRLSRSFGSVRAADAVDLAVARGEAVGIIGPNGAGKTTLFNLIAGNLDADAGEIRLNGVDITWARTHQRCVAGIGRAYQIPHPFENLTVFENLLVAAVHGRGGQADDGVDFCAAILEDTGLVRRAN